MNEPRDPDQVEPIPDVRNDPVPEPAAPEDGGEPDPTGAEQHDGAPE